MEKRRIWRSDLTIAPLAPGAVANVGVYATAGHTSGATGVLQTNAIRQYLQRRG